MYRQVTQASEKVITCDIINWKESSGQETSNRDLYLEHRKTIDAFRDGKENPDTTLDNTEQDLSDFYRLYLDVTAEVQTVPVDVLFVVDRSSSMSRKDVPYRYTDESGTEQEINIQRDESVNMVLNGDDVSPGGLLATILAMNPDNKVAVTSYCGLEDKDSEPYTYEVDSKVLLKWTGGQRDPDGNVTVDKADATCEEKAGTNYTAGLESAKALFDQVKDNGHKKVMIFLSDGVPTFYIDESGNRKGDASGTPKNVELCREPTKESFKRFHLACPEVKTYTIGISSDINGTGDGEYTDPEVLKYMAARGGGSFMGIADENQFMSMMTAIFMGYSEELCPSNVSITDTLSQYAMLYEKQPDYRMTMTDGEGNVTVLYEGGAVTEEGKEIIDSITYSSSDSENTVSAKFRADYKLVKGNVYTLSFNVKTTRYAYDTFSENQNSGGDGYAGVTGDKETDYGENTTSSEKPGFHSNSGAVLAYRQGEKNYELKYDYPVVQVTCCSFYIKKVSKSNKNTTLKGAQFDLYRKAEAGETGSVSVEGLEGEYIRVNSSAITTDESGTALVENLPPGTYYLKETKAPDGYNLLYSPIEIALSKTSVSAPYGSGASGITGETVLEGKIPTLTVSNSSGVVLPETGGTGTTPYTVAGVLLILAPCLLYRKICSGKEGKYTPTKNEQK